MNWDHIQQQLPPQHHALLQMIRTAYEGGGAESPERAVDEALRNELDGIERGPMPGGADAA